jgi:hypothetical protein
VRKPEESERKKETRSTAETYGEIPAQKWKNAPMAIFGADEAYFSRNGRSRRRKQTPSWRVIFVHGKNYQNQKTD